MLQTQRCDPQPQGKTYFYSADPVVQHQRHHILFSDAPLSRQPLIWRRSVTLEDPRRRLTFCRRSSGQWRSCCCGDSEGRRPLAGARGGMMKMWPRWRRGFLLLRPADAAAAARPWAADPWRGRSLLLLTGRDSHAGPQQSPSWWFQRLLTGSESRQNHNRKLGFKLQLQLAAGSSSWGSSSRSGRRWRSEGGFFSLNWLPSSH